MGLTKNVQPKYSIFAPSLLADIAHGNQITPQRITLVHQGRSSASLSQEGIDVVAAHIAANQLNWQVINASTSDAGSSSSCPDYIYSHYRPHVALIFSASRRSSSSISSGVPDSILSAMHEFMAYSRACSNCNALPHSSDASTHRDMRVSNKQLTNNNQDNGNNVSSRLRQVHQIMVPDVCGVVQW